MFKQKVDPYDHFDITAKENDLEITVGEPDMCNPNSKSNILRVLRGLGGRAKIHKYNDLDESKRTWIFMETDGGISIYIFKFIFNQIICKACKKEFYGRESFDKHQCTDLPELEYEFDWIVPQSGLLHIEINAGKSLMSLCWDVFFQEICKELGFVSPNALAYAKKGSDHHKMWDILEITYIAFSDEIISMFVTECKRIDAPITAKNFWIWKSQLRNPNILFVLKITFVYLHALIMLRRGYRFNNAEYICCNRSTVISVFGRNHSNYHFREES